MGALDREYLLARLAAERANLLCELIGLDETVLTGQAIIGEWTAKDLLAHVAGWDELFTRRIDLIVAGLENEMTHIEVEPHNRSLYTARRNWSLDRAVKICTTARTAFLNALAQVPDTEFQRRRLPMGRRTIQVWATWRWQHDATHARHLRLWRQVTSPRPGAGPQCILLAALHASRQELLATAALISTEERETRPVCGHWTLKDLYGHLADRESRLLAGASQFVTHRPLEMAAGEDEETWNQTHVQARREQPWEQVWADFHTARQILYLLLAHLSQEDLAWPFVHSGATEDSLYQWACTCLTHDRAHAATIRAGLALEWR